VVRQPTETPGTVRCPNCGERDTRVVDSRDLDDAAIRRRRECATCNSRFTTYERIESARLTVVKRNGMREDFDRAKVAAGIQKALTRRPVPAGAADEAADAIEAHLRSLGANEVSSTTVGELSMERLRALDQIAYIRFASVYQSFDDLEQLKREVDTLFAERSPEVPGQVSLELVAPAPKRLSLTGPGGSPTRRPTRRR